MSRKPADPTSWLCFLVLLAVLAAAEGLCAALAHDTLGEVTSGVLMVAVVLLNLLPLVLFAGGLRAVAVAVVPGGQGFGFSFWVGTRGTSRSYGVTAERAGGWGYYPD
ncbi:MAG TPA: hypothetical protein VKY89_14030 [Thermoanaerobaculia bacterium]|nr:hypothetical protein [Thermoanaerobaculia bacterium]